MRVAVVGLGHLGLPLALLLAEAGHEVIGVDTSPDHLARLRSGEAPHHEAGLQQMLDDHGMMVDWRSEPSDAAECDLSFVVVPTPSLPSGAFDVSAVCGVAEAIGGALDGRSHVLCCVSTTNPGDCEGPIAQALTAGAGRELGGASNVGGLAITYAPEFVALGEVFAGMRRPDLLLIGESHSWAGDRVSYLLRSIRLWGPGDEAGVPHVAAEHRLSLTEAEIAKLSVNAYITMRLSYVNTLGELCDGYGADGHRVAAAVGSDSRIGSRYFSPGRAFGGPCFPRDSAAFQVAAHEVKVTAHLAAATDLVNDHQLDRWIEAVIEAHDGGRVAVLGLAYKPGTAVTERSFGVDLARMLIGDGFDVVCFDPLATVDGLPCAASLPDAVDGAGVVVLANDDPLFARGYDAAVVDCMAMMED